MYSTKKKQGNLNELRYSHFVKSTLRTSIKLESLPPTEAAAKEHSLRTYLQVQQWLGHKNEATQWGWKIFVHGLQPKYTEDTLIPDELIKKIICRCETGCNGQTCNCRKHGLRCSYLCVNCHGESCSNIEDFLEIPINQKSAINLDIDLDITQETIIDESEKITINEPEES
ncbi:PREDICTED: uncharacterized protein LOC108769764 [Trachymyrmex cornetzi]|uniref:uncharacterized protein LOC108769762 n=1 Tax=Trachymyrmex cornetzi TaxID=471704 RepID=UPI00084F4784|nr:PREDICTED: uncharacterized protein LOC108769762 [Trachymyrmex cornetzi]XP_018376453.1 PREDICTED: uncharacterized protein LOC108769764 [Trachymyrmex cornetzi]